MRPQWTLAILFLTTAAAQQTPPPEPTKRPEPAAQDAAAKKPTALAQLLAADEAGRSAALAKFLDEQLATGAIFSGQYDVLKKLGWDATPMLRAWMVEPPKDTEAEPAAFREGSINALRDCVVKAPEELIAELQKLATGYATPEQLASKAKYALAQFGKTEHVDKMIEQATKNTTSNDVSTRSRAWGQLADVYYNIRRYEDAAKAYGEFITVVEAGNPHFQGLPTNYYNCACSYALAGNKKQALERLTKALEIGAKGRQLNVDLLQTDMDIRSLRGEPEFAALMKKYFGIDMPASGDGKSAEPAKESKEGADKR